MAGREHEMATGEQRNTCTCTAGCRDTNTGRRARLPIWDARLARTALGLPCQYEHCWPWDWPGGYAGTVRNAEGRRNKRKTQRYAEGKRWWRLEVGSCWEKGTLFGIPRKERADVRTVHLSFTFSSHQHPTHQPHFPRAALPSSNASRSRNFLQYLAQLGILSVFSLSRTTNGAIPPAAHSSWGLGRRIRGSQAEYPILPSYTFFGAPYPRYPLQSTRPTVYFGYQDAHFPVLPVR
jgi:hypothetical protein